MTIFLLVATGVPGGRTALLGGLVIVWALRLGTFLFVRISRSGGDGRFDEIKPDTLRFLGVWTIQVTLLLTKVSGIPLLEKRAERKWGDGPAYRRYVESTPVLIPRLGAPRH